MNKFWNERYESENKIWGVEPSKTAQHAHEIFDMFGVSNVLVPGSGYGRHTEYFHQNDYQVTGIELSEAALEITEKSHEIKYYRASVLDQLHMNEEFNGIYCFNLIQLFLEEDRKKFIDSCYQWLDRLGIIYFAALSEKDSGYGKGVELETNTFENKLGRAAHFFTESEWIDTFAKFQIIESGIIEEVEIHGSEGDHTHHLRYMVASKK